ncbi:hypothetical protein [Arthrobacter sp. EPSL27]|uniref:hypothetical protein n=1 Tax=Arthrobacter sp. EPSL27 TaxID=1745378 RepID=UPI0007465BD4|nr:hypothetical protein [Arthrobacter sp. EPSL27]KUM32508.1 hypothetical protein AR539_18400 [Arthrobacter sp. EPSL27]
MQSTTGEPTGHDSLHFLEIRVHGVRGTRPWESLGVPQGVQQPCEPAPPGVGKDTVDNKTGFYCSGRARPGASEATTVDPDLDGGRKLHVEAYFWGMLTSGAWGFESLLRSFWLLLAPFAFVNVAMWSRPGLSSAGRRQYVTAVLIRWSGLLLTCLLLGTICSIAVDLVAWQCFRHGTSWCASISVLTPVFGSSRAVERIVIAAILPLAGLAVLLTLSRQSMRKTEARKPHHTYASESVHDHRILRRPAFWEGKDRTNSLLTLHVACGLCVVAILGAAPVHALESGGSWVLPVPLACAAGVLLAVFLLTAVGVLDQIEHGPSEKLRRTRQMGPRVVLAAAAAALAANIVWLWNGHGTLDQSGQLPLASDFQIAITASLFALVYLLAAVLSAVWFAWVAGVILAAFITMQILDPVVIRDNFWAGAGLLVAVLLVGAVVHGRSRKGVVLSWAWFGLAPAYLLSFAAFLGVMYSSVATLFSAAILDGRLNPALLKPSTPHEVSAEVSLTLAVPSPFLWFAMLFLPGLVIAAVVVVILLLRFRRNGAPDIRDLAQKDQAAERQANSAALLGRTTRSRYLAAVIHRAEALLGALIMVPLSMGLLATLGMFSGQDPYFPALVQWGAVLAAVTGAILLVLIALSIFHEDLLRAVAVIWDLATFWPRAAHPFSPPCYGERVVPELLDRISGGLAGMASPGNAGTDPPCRATDRQATAKYDYVILSGHSLGSAILAAVMLQLPDAVLPRIRFVTYGSQLRAWFGRFFPDLLGPAVLGHQATARPDFRTAVPDAPPQPPADGFTPPEGSLASLLQGPRHWQNFYRRTDYLGFRVLQDSENDVDHRVSDWDPNPVGTQKAKPLDHSQYQESAPYGRLIRSWIAPDGDGIPKP